MKVYPCPCDGCRGGRHSNGRICLYCAGNGHYRESDWPRPCWSGYNSADMGPSGPRTARRTRRPSRAADPAQPAGPPPRTAGDRIVDNILGAPTAPTVPATPAGPTGPTATPAPAAPAGAGGPTGPGGVTGYRTARELSRALDGSWVVTVRTANGAVDVQDVRLGYRSLGRCTYRATSRSGPARANGSWQARNGTQIQVDAVLTMPGFGGTPFRPVITFAVPDRDQMYGFAPGVTMWWRRA